MALVLRACILSQRRRCLEEFTLSSRNIAHIKYSGNVKRLAPALQAQFSTKNDTNFETSKLIYYGKLTKHIRNVKLFSLFTSFGGICCQPFLLMRATETDNMLAMTGMLAITGFFILGNPLLLHFISKKYVTHIYYNPENRKYIANMYTLFLRKRQIEFRPNDVVIPSVPGMFASCRIKGKPVFIEQSHFSEPNHYKHIMGYDKPMDFKLNHIDEPPTPLKFKSINDQTETHTQNKVQKLS